MRRVSRLIRTASLCGRAALFAAIIVILGSLRGVPDLPGWILLLPGSLAVLAALRPAAALTALAALAPLASFAGREVNGIVLWPEALALSFLAGWIGRGLRRPPAPTRCRTTSSV